MPDNMHLATATKVIR